MYVVWAMNGVLVIKNIKLNTMWNTLPFDLLSILFSYLCPHSLARAFSTCRHWHTCSNYLLPPRTLPHHPAWFLALPTRRTTLCFYTHSPKTNIWHALPLGSGPNPVRPVATVHGLVLFRPVTTTTTRLQLAIYNPFTTQFKYLPDLKIPRTNPAVGLIELNRTHNHYPATSFRIYVAGGMSDASAGGTEYERTLEMYDSNRDTWTIIASMPVEFSVRLTVWTPNESVYSRGVIYWMTSARAYSVMGFEIETNKWRELGVPLADRLEFAAIVPRNGKVTLVGGTVSGEACVWELGIGDEWEMIEKVPFELKVRFLSGKQNWEGTKCVGIEGTICLYRDIGSGMVIWRENVDDKVQWEWFWIEACSLKGKQLQNFPVKGLLLHPNLGLIS